MRKRYSQEFFDSSGYDVEDDACSSLLGSKSRSWNRTQIIIDVLWIASTAFILYMGDRSSNFFALLWGDNRIKRIPLYFGTVCAILNIVLVVGTAFWSWSMRKVDDKWETLSLSLAPALALLVLLSFVFLSIALWPVWSFLTLPLLFTLFMTSMVAATGFYRS